MKTVKVRLGSNSYEIRIGPDILIETGPWLKEIGFKPEKLVIITDPIVKGLYGNALKQSLADEGFKVIILEVPAGEEQKSLETAARLYRELSDFYAERTTPILALGGGVIGDLAGFVAATYLRGVPLIQIPTTLLAQVDSSIGGKVAVDHGQLKNKIGAFYQPRLVISDITTLRTLTAEELSDGLAEVIKYAVISDKGFFTYLERNLEQLLTLPSPVNGEGWKVRERLLEEIISRCSKIKAEVVEKDEKDFGLRNILNYGHTIGHAIESASDFKVEHGRAVAIGMLRAGEISSKMGIFDENELTRLKGVIERAGLLTKMPGLDVGRIVRAMEHDKKVSGGKIRFVLPKSIGEVFISDEVSPSLIEQVLVTWNGES